MHSRDRLGEIVRNIWVEFAKEQAEKTGIPAKPNHLLLWDDLDEDNKEVDRRIGEQIYKLAALEQTSRLKIVFEEMAEASKNHAESFADFLPSNDVNVITHKAYQEAYSRAAKRCKFTE